MDSSSVSAQAQGVATGGRKTKYEVQQLQEGALNLASLFLSMMENSLADKYWLRMHNILQYYSQPSSVESGKPKFKFIKVENTKLTNGKMGDRLLQIVSDDQELPDKTEVMDMMRKESGEEDILESRVEPIFITRDYLMNKEAELSMRIVPNSSIKESEAERARKDIAFYQATAQNPIFDQELNAKDFAAAFDKPEEIVKRPDQREQIPGGEERPVSQPVDLEAI
jgi:hypothetical protein